MATTESKCRKCGMPKSDQKGVDFLCFRLSGTEHDNVDESIDMIADVAAFHDKFGLAYVGPPRLMPDELRQFRVDFLQEEADEYSVASDAGQWALHSGSSERVTHCLAEQLDALVDVIYVALGNAYMQGLPVAEAWRRVHAANMAKIRATESTASDRGGVHDVVKPPGWKAPDHTDLVVRNAHVTP